jgi:uncharacterized membrane protein YebE (DUF533 family)
MTEDIAPSVRSALWANAYAKLFARLVVENNPDARQAYFNALSGMMELRQAIKERQKR